MSGRVRHGFLWAVAMLAAHGVLDLVGLSHWSPLLYLVEALT